MRRPSNKFGDVLLAGTIMLGAAAFGHAVIYWIKGTYQATLSDRRESVFLAFRSDGEPYLNHLSFTRSAAVYSATDLDGGPIAVNRQGDLMMSMDLPAEWPLAKSTRPLPWSDRILGFANERSPSDSWYLIHDGLPAGHAYFEGFSTTTKTRLGFIGTAGFREDAVPLAERFPIRGGENWNYNQIACQYSHYRTSFEPPYASQATGPGQFGDSLVFLNGESTVYEIDLNSRQVRQPLPPAATPIRSIGLGGAFGKDWLGVRSDDAVQILDPDGRQTTLPLAPELRGQDLEIARHDTGFMVAALMNADRDSGNYRVRVFSVAFDGKLSSPKDVTVARFGNSNWVAPDTYVASLLLLGAPATLTGSTLGIRPLEFTRPVVGPTWQTRAMTTLADHAAYLTAAAIAGLALAIACYRREYPYGAGRRERLLWSLFVLLFGLPGWVGYRYRCQWPLLEPCPACHQLAPRDEPSCARCRHAFPAAGAVGH